MPFSIILLNIYTNLITAYSSITAIPTYEAFNADVDGGDSGYESDNEWNEERTVDEWRRSIKRTRGTPLRAWTEPSRNFGEEAANSQYEADDEWRGRPKMSQIRNSMKRRR